MEDIINIKSIKVPFIALDGSEHTDIESARRADKIFGNKVQGKDYIAPIAIRERAENVLKPIPLINDDKIKINNINLGMMSYAEWNRMRIFFMNSLNSNKLTPEMALVIAEYLRDAHVSIQNVQDAFVMKEQLDELLGIICTLKEQQILGLK